jgi:hypothetical protein
VANNSYGKPLEGSQSTVQPLAECALTVPVPELRNVGGDVMGGTIELSGWTFSMLPISIIKDADTSATAFRVYAALATYANSDKRCWPGVRRLAGDIGVNEKTVRRAIADLKDRGWLSVRRRGFKKTNVYTLFAEPLNSDRTRVSGHQDTNSSEWTPESDHERAPVSNKRYPESNDIQIPDTDAPKPKNALHVALNEQLECSCSFSLCDIWCGVVQAWSLRWSGLDRQYLSRCTPTSFDADTRTLVVSVPSVAMRLLEAGHQGLESSLAGIAQTPLQLRFVAA